MKPHTLLSLGTGVLLALAAGCQKNHVMEMPVKVNYPAAYVVNGESNSISVIDLASNEVKATIKLGDASSSGGHGGAASDGLMWPHHFGLHPNGSTLAIGVPGMDLSEGHAGGVAGMKGKIAVVNATDGKFIRTIELPITNHNAIYSPDGKEIWTSQMDDAGKVLVYDAGSYALKNTIGVGKQPAEVTFSADGTAAFVANALDNSVTVIDPATKVVKATVAVGADPVGAWAGSDNRMYVDNEEGKSITVVNARTYAVEATIDLGFMPGYAAYHAAGQELWVTDPDRGQVHFYHRMNNVWMPSGEVVAGAGAHAIAFTQDGKTAYVTNQMAGSVSVIDAVAHAKVKDIPVGMKPNGIVIRY